MTSASHAVRRSSGGGWLTLGLFWLLALSYIVLSGANYRAIAKGADDLERLMWQRQPIDAPGRGACAAFARTQPPLMYDPDGLVWINLTQRQYQQGQWRARDFPFDNTPHGRERHWSQSFSWWLLALGAVTSAATGQPMETAIAQAANWANPVLFGLFLAGLGLWMRRRVGAWTAGVFLVTLAALWGVEWDFSYGRPDHHGMHLIAFLGMLLTALAGGLGWVREGQPSPQEEADESFHLARPASERQARRWFAASGIFGGMGLWIGATHQCFGIGTLGIGIVLGALAFAKPAAPGETVRFAPELWRFWARAGAMASLAFYALEYFPFHLAMRLEVNHPLYALAWLGGGEVMWAVMRTKLDRSTNKPDEARKLFWRGTLGALGMAALPLTLFFGPASWWVLRDPVLARSVLMISEGRPWIDRWLPSLIGREVWNYLGMLWLALPLAAAIPIFGGKKHPPHRRAAILAAGVPTAAFLLWTILQNRSMGFTESALAVLALLVGPCLPLNIRANAKTLPMGLLALALPGWAGYAQMQMRTLGEEPMRHARALLSDTLAYKETAWNVRLYADANKEEGGNAVPRVMALPGPGPILHYYGGFETVGSYYWENFGSCRETADFYADEGDATARRIARERGLDFVLAVSRPEFMLEAQTLQLGRVDVPAALKTLAFRLSSSHGAAPPDWLELLPLLDAPVAVERGIQLYRVRRDRL